MVEQDPFGFARRERAAAAEGVHLVRPARTTDVVLLDRVDDIAQADTEYCIHGKTTCVRCGEWCWLGDQSHRLAASGRAAPLCRRCAVTVVTPGTRRVAQAGDHRRADGPH